MILLSVEEIIRIHEKVIRKTSGSQGVRDIGLLESAVYSAENSFSGIEQYPSVEEKSARLMYAITNNHAFVDGNKRIGIVVMLLTLNLNKVELEYTQNELIDLGISVASGKYRYEDVLCFITKHKTNK